MGSLEGPEIKDFLDQTPPIAEGLSEAPTPAAAERYEHQLPEQPETHKQLKIDYH